VGDGLRSAHGGGAHIVVYDFAVDLG